nr:pre-toxin TG domain-containing protein [Enterococcus sp. BWB1-3]
MNLALGVGSASNAITGKDWLTGRELSTTEKVVEGAGSLLTLIPGASSALKGTAEAGKSTLVNSIKQGVQNVTNNMNGGNLAMAGGGILDDAVTVIANGANSQAGAITSTGAQTGTQIVMAARGDGGGDSRHANKIKPDPDATGEHDVFKCDPDTGEITNYKEYKPNPKNPSGFDEVKGYDGVGKPHTNKTTGEKLMPHVHDKTVPGGVRVPRPDEIPKTP